VQGKNAAKFEQYQLAEIKHSRLAMLAFSGLVASSTPSASRLAMLALPLAPCYVCLRRVLLYWSISSDLSPKLFMNSTFPQFFFLYLHSNLALWASASATSTSRPSRVCSSSSATSRRSTVPKAHSFPTRSLARSSKLPSLSPLFLSSLFLAVASQ